MILITGCGRSGTLYIARVLRKCGLRVGHEKLRRDGLVHWRAVKWDTPDVLRKQFRPILHQVRHPLKVIGSSCTLKDHSWEYVAQYTTCVQFDDPVVRGARYWLEWTDLCDELADGIYTVESLRTAEGWAAFCEMAGLPEGTERPEVSRRTHHRDHPEVSWSDLERSSSGLARLIRQKAEDYGYEVT